MGIGLTLLGAGVAVVAASSSSEMDQVLGVYAGGWLAVMGGITLIRRSHPTRRPGQDGPRPTRPVTRPVGGGAA